MKKLSPIFVILAFTTLASGAEISGQYLSFERTVTQQLTTITYSPTVKFEGGPGGPRDYVALFASATATTFIPGQWRYLDNTKTPNPDRKLTGGTVKFADIVALPELEARFYRWMPGTPHVLLHTIQIRFPQVELKYFYQEGSSHTVTREPIGEWDKVTVKRDGANDVVILDRSILLTVHKIATLAALPVQENP